MSRRIRTAALLSAATVLVGGSFTLALAPAAFAATGDPTLGSLSYTPDTPQAGDDLVIKGGGCIPNILPQAAPADATAAPADDPVVGSVRYNVSGPASFNSGGTVETNTDGDWASNSDGDVITLGGAGTYTIDASCQLLGVGIYSYASASFTIADTTPPPATVDPSVSVSPTQNVAPGTGVSITGTGFGDATSVSVALAGYATQTASVQGGSFIGVKFLIRDDQSAGTLAGTVTANGATTSIAVQNYSIAVVVPQSGGGGTADGPVGGTGSSSTSTTNSSTTTGSSAGTTSTTPRYTSTGKPTLPNTGVDSLWPAVTGGLLVLAGAALLWTGRRREEIAPTAV